MTPLLQTWALVLPTGLSNSNKYKDWLAKIRANFKENYQDLESFLCVKANKHQFFVSLGGLWKAVQVKSMTGMN